MFAPIPKPYMKWYEKGSLKSLVDEHIATVEEVDAVEEFNEAYSKLMGWKFEGWAFAKHPYQSKFSDKYKILPIVSQLGNKKIRKLAYIDGSTFTIVDVNEVFEATKEKINL